MNYGNVTDIIFDGQYQFYLPIKFTYSKPNKAIYKSSRLINDEIIIAYYDNITDEFLRKNSVDNYYQRALDHNLSCIQKNIDSFNKKYKEDGLKINYEAVRNEMDEDFKNIFWDDLFIDLSTFEDSFPNPQIYILSKFLLNFEQVIDYNSAKLAHDCKVFGENLIKSDSKRFILYPIKFTRNGSEVGFINLTLDIFFNQTAIIKVEFRFNSSNIEDFEEESIAKNFETLLVPKFLTDEKIEYEEMYDYIEVDSQDVFEVVHKYYLNHIHKYYGIDFIEKKPITNIIITNQNIKIKNFIDIPENMQELLYRLTYRPIDPLVNVENRMNLIEDVYWGNDEMRVYCSEAGNLVSIASDLKSLESYDEHIDPLEYSEIKLNSLDFAVDIPLKLFLLKIINQDLLFVELNFSKNNNIEDIKSRYLAHELVYPLLISDLYGSAKKLIEFFEKNMTLYYDKSEMNLQNENSEKLLNINRNKSIQRLNTYIIVGTFFLTILFALPTLKETFTIILDTWDFGFDKTSQASVINNLSTISWLILIAIQLFIIIVSWINSKFNLDQLLMTQADKLWTLFNDFKLRKKYYFKRPHDKKNNQSNHN